VGAKEGKEGGRKGEAAVGGRTEGGKEQKKTLKKKYDMHTSSPGGGDEGGMPRGRGGKG